jgi:hypothetical protein
MSVDHEVPVLLRPTTVTPESRFRSRRNALVVIAVLTAVAYSAFGAASWGYCAGGFSSDGGYLDAGGQPTTVAPQCISAILQPSQWVYLVIALVAIAGIWFASRNLEHAVGRLGIAALIVVAVGVLATAGGWLAFSQLSSGGWESGSLLEVPPYLNVMVEYSPMMRG